MKGTITWATFVILLSPPMITRPTHMVRMIPEITIVHEYSMPNNLKATCFVSGSKKFLTALEIPFTWVNVPILKRPTHTPKKANIFASHFQFLPIPFSI